MNTVTVMAASSADEAVSLPRAAGSMFRRRSKDTANVRNATARASPGAYRGGGLRRLGHGEAKMPLTWVIDHQARMVVATGASILHLEDFEAALDELARPAPLSYRK